MVTVIDCFNFHQNLQSVETVTETIQKGEELEETEIPLCHLLIDQIEFADVIVLNKTDLVSANQLREINALIKRLNPVAKTVNSTFGNVPLPSIINTKLFNFEEAQKSAGWMKELEKPAHTPETEEYGIKSWVYRRKRPFHPKRIHDFFESLDDEANTNHIFKACIRAKGTLWISSRNFMSFQFQKAGTLWEFGPLDLWFAAIPKKKWASDRDQVKEIEDYLKGVWTPTFGDRQQELVFIGINMDRPAMEKMLDACILTNEEFKLGPEGWAHFEDPFPKEFTEQLRQRHIHINQDSDDEDEDSDEENKHEEKVTKRKDITKKKANKKSTTKSTA